MKTSSIFRRATLAIVPAAALFFSACSKSDDPIVVPAAPQGRVNFYHAASGSNVSFQFLADDVQKAAIPYGQTSGYQSVTAGARTIRVVSAGSTVATQQLAVDADKSYSLFAYSPTATIGSAGVFSVTDDLTAPATGTAKVRLVHLGVGAATPVRLSIPSATPTGSPTDLTADVAFGTASSFIVVNAGSALSLSVTSAVAPRTQVVAVGDGTGTGTGSKTFDSGKIYTVVVQGISGAGVPAAQQIQAIISANN